MQVGFIGLGTMGASMATNLQKAGYKLVVHDLCQNSATPHLNAGAQWAESPKVLAAQCQVIFTSLPGPPEVEAVALAPTGCSRGWRGLAPRSISPPTHQRSYARSTSSAASGTCTCLTPR